MIQTKIAEQLGIAVGDIKRGKSFIMKDDALCRVYRIVKTFPLINADESVEAICINDGQDLTIAPGIIVIPGKLEGELTFSPNLPD